MRGLWRFNPVWDRMRTELHRRMAIDFASSESTTLLFGTGRGGTSWLAQMLTCSPGQRYLFEPFHRERTRAWRGQAYLPYIPRLAQAPVLHNAAEKILAGRVSSHWVDQHNTAWLAHSRLIKEIRAQWMIGWLREQFPAIKMVWAIRHPIPTALSRVKLGWDPHLDLALAQPELMRDHLDPWADVLRRLHREGSPLEQAVARWCLDTHVPRRELRSGEVLVVFYERLCRDPFGEMERVFDYLERPMPERLEQAVNRVSPHFRRESAVLSGNDPVTHWMKRISSIDCSQAEAVLERFGYADWYDAMGMPTLDESQVWSRSQATPVTSKSISPYREAG